MAVFFNFEELSLKKKLFVLVSFPILVFSLLFYMFGDRFFFWQGEKNEEIKFAYPAFEAYERVIFYFPSSTLASEARIRSNRIILQHPDLRSYYLKEGLFKHIASIGKDISPK